METMNHPLPCDCENHDDCDCLGCEACGESFPEDQMVRVSYQEDYDTWDYAYFCKKCHKGPEVDEAYTVFPSDDPMDDIPFLQAATGEGAG